LYLWRNIEARVVQTLLLWKNKNFDVSSLSVCSIRYATCNTYLWPAPPYNIFPRFLINGTILEKRHWTQNVVLIFSIKLVWNISHSEKNWARYDEKCISVCLWSNGYLSDFTENCIFWTVFGKKKHISKLMKINLVRVELFHTNGQKDRQTWRR
jgi:hypothetical protein